MASINISIKKEAYDFLNQFKQNDMSFSDVILSFKKDDKNIMKYFGKLKGVDWNKRKKEMNFFRKSFEEKLK
jgi:predicted CopG family antitoxin